MGASAIRARIGGIAASMTLIQHHHRNWAHTRLKWDRTKSVRRNVARRMMGTAYERWYPAKKQDGRRRCQAIAQNDSRDSNMGRRPPTTSQAHRRAYRGKRSEGTDSRGRVRGGFARRQDEQEEQEVERSGEEDLRRGV